MRWYAGPRWRIALLGGLAALALATAAVGLGSAGEGEWARWRQAMSLFAGSSAVMVLLAVGEARRRSAFHYASAGVVVITALVAGALALMFGTGSALVGDWTAAAGTVPLLLTSGLGTLVLVWQLKRERRRVLPPFRRLTPEAFRNDLDPPAYPEPVPEAADDGGVAGPRRRSLVDRFFRALTMRR